MEEKHVNIEGSFELPTEKDWEYLNSEWINKIRIDIADFQAYKDRIMLYPRIAECIFGFNNKVGSLCITYVMCRHYFDLGIPDEPWYVSPSLDGKKSVQYMPNFKPEHYMRLFWFNHFAANLYVTAFGIWDSIIEMLNIFYDINAKPDLRQRNEVLEWLKANQTDVFTLFNALKDNSVYKTANAFRTQFVHGVAPSEISDQHNYKKSIEAKILDTEATNNSGKAVYKTVTNATVMSVGVGKYTLSKDVVKAFDEFVKLTALKKNEIIALMTKDKK